MLGANLASTLYRNPAALLASSALEGQPVMSAWVMNFEGDKTALRTMIQFQNTPLDFAVNATDAAGAPVTIVDDFSGESLKLAVNPEYLSRIYLHLERGSGLDRDYFGVLNVSLAPKQPLVADKARCALRTRLESPEICKGSNVSSYALSSGPL
jgi:hypothetical protein